MDERESFCRLASSSAGESQFGTAAAGVDAWFVLEYDGAWAAKAWEAAELPAAVRAHVDAWVAATPGARIQLAKRDDRRTRDGVVLLLANSRQGSGRVAQYELRTLDELTALDLHAAMAALRQGRLPAGAGEPSVPVVLVCTNGKRDRCCAKWGLPVYEAFAADRRVQTWQTTHLGGHRFAATLVWLPGGICHGRVAPEHVDGLIDAVIRGDIGPLELLRGRTSLGEAGQAAEYLWRHQHGLQGMDDVVIDTATPEGELWRVGGRVREQAVSIVVRPVQLGTTAAPSCGKPPEPVSGWERA